MENVKRKYCYSGAVRRFEHVFNVSPIYTEAVSVDQARNNIEGKIKDSLRIPRYYKLSLVSDPILIK